MKQCTLAHAATHTIRYYTTVEHAMRLQLQHTRTRRSRRAHFAAMWRPASDKRTRAAHPERTRAFTHTAAQPASDVEQQPTTSTRSAGGRAVGTQRARHAHARFASHIMHGSVVAGGSNSNGAAPHTQPSERFARIYLLRALHQNVTYYIL